MQFKKFCKLKLSCAYDLIAQLKLLNLATFFTLPCIASYSLLLQAAVAKLKTALLRNGERPKTNGHLQNVKRQRDITSALQSQTLTVLNNLFRRDKTSASQQSSLQRAHVILQSLAPQAQAVLHGLLRISTLMQSLVACKTVMTG